MADRELIGHLAELSGIRFSAAELEKMQAEMEDVMHLMDQVKNAPNNVESDRQARTEYAQLRTDAVKQSDGNNIEFTVPKIVG